MEERTDLLPENFQNSSTEKLDITVTQTSIKLSQFEDIDPNKLISSPFYQKTLLQELSTLKEEEAVSCLQSIFEQLKGNNEALIVLRDIIFFNQKQYLLVHRKANENFPLSWEWYVRKNCATVMSGEYGNDPNFYFGNECHKEVLVELERLRSGKIQSLMDLYKGCAERRAAIAKHTKSTDWQKFGMLRNNREDGDFCYTPIRKGLSHYRQKIQEKLSNMIKNSKPFEEIEGYVFYNLEKDAESKFIVVTYEEKIVYICVMVRVNRDKFVVVNRIILELEGGRVNCYFVNDSINLLCMAPETRYNSILHCNSRNIDPVWNLADKIFQKLINGGISASSETKLKQIAYLHWLLSHIMITKRGNAAISEMVITVLLLYNDFYITPYKENIIGDMEALTTPVSQFEIEYNFFREVDLMVSSEAERKILNSVGGVMNLQKLPVFPYVSNKHMGWTLYPNISNDELKEEIAHFRDQYRRKMIVIKSFSENPHILFQRSTSGDKWHYLPPVGEVTNDPEKFPLDIISSKLFDSTPKTGAL